MLRRTLQPLVDDSSARPSASHRRCRRRHTVLTLLLLLLLLPKVGQDRDPAMTSDPEPGSALGTKQIASA